MELLEHLMYPPKEFFILRCCLVAPRAVTFIGNHDTGSTQAHSRFPGGKEMHGYTYILTQLGTSSVFYDDMFSRYKFEISTLILLRKQNKIQCQSTVRDMGCINDQIIG
ncbi:putative alpha-amylase [Helianthus anomalus]